VKSVFFKEGKSAEQGRSGVPFLQTEHVEYCETC